MARHNRSVTPPGPPPLFLDPSTSSNFVDVPLFDFPNPPGDENQSAKVIRAGGDASDSPDDDEGCVSPTDDYYEEARDFVPAYGRKTIGIGTTQPSATPSRSANPTPDCATQRSIRKSSIIGEQDIQGIRADWDSNGGGSDLEEDGSTQIVEDSPELRPVSNEEANRKLDELDKLFEPSYWLQIRDESREKDHKLRDPDSGLGFEAYPRTSPTCPSPCHDPMRCPNVTLRNMTTARGAKQTASEKSVIKQYKDAPMHQGKNLVGKEDQGEPRLEEPKSKGVRDSAHITVGHVLSSHPEEEAKKRAEGRRPTENPVEKGGTSLAKGHILDEVAPLVIVEKSRDTTDPNRSMRASMSGSESLVESYCAEKAAFTRMVEDCVSSSLDKHFDMTLEKYLQNYLKTATELAMKRSFDHGLKRTKVEITDAIEKTISQMMSLQEFTSRETTPRLAAINNQTIRKAAHEAVRTEFADGFQSTHITCDLSSDQHGDFVNDLIQAISHSFVETSMKTEVDKR